MMKIKVKYLKMKKMRWLLMTDILYYLTAAVLYVTSMSTYSIVLNVLKT